MNFDLWVSRWIGRGLRVRLELYDECILCMNEEEIGIK